MLRVGLPIMLLVGWAVATPATRSATAQTQMVTIKGSVAYEASELPAESSAVIELRHVPALPNAPAVVVQRIPLQDKLSPVPFELTVDRYKLVRGATYLVRSAIVSGTSAIRTSEDIKIDVTGSAVDVKEITLTPPKAG